MMDQENYYQSKLTLLKGVIEDSFQKLNPQAGKISGNIACRHFLSSNLPKKTLADIWELSDLDTDGFLTLSEFYYMSLLIEQCKDGFELPRVTPRSLLKVVANAFKPTVDIPSNNRYDNISQLFSQSIASDDSPQNKTIEPPEDVSPVFKNENEHIRDHSDEYTNLFRKLLRPGESKLSGEQARNALLKSELPKMVLAEIWELSDKDFDGCLNHEEFIFAMSLIEQKMPPSTFNVDKFLVRSEDNIQPIERSPSLSATYCQENRRGSVDYPIAQNVGNTVYSYPSSDLLTEKLQSIISSTSNDINKKEIMLKNLQGRASEIISNINVVKSKYLEKGPSPNSLSEKLTRFSIDNDSAKQPRDSISCRDFAMGINFSNQPSTIHHPNTIKTSVEIHGKAASDHLYALSQTATDINSNTLFDTTPIFQNEEPSIHGLNFDTTNNAMDLPKYEQQRQPGIQSSAVKKYEEISDIGSRVSKNEENAHWDSNFANSDMDKNEPKRISYSSHFSSDRALERNFMNNEGPGKTSKDKPSPHKGLPPQTITKTGHARHESKDDWCIPERNDKSNFSSRTLNEQKNSMIKRSKSSPKATPQFEKNRKQSQKTSKNKSSLGFIKRILRRKSKNKPQTDMTYSRKSENVVPTYNNTTEKNTLRPNFSNAVDHADQSDNEEIKYDDHFKTFKVEPVDDLTEIAYHRNNSQPSTYKMELPIFPDLPQKTSVYQNRYLDTNVIPIYGSHELGYTDPLGSRSSTPEVMSGVDDESDMGEDVQAIDPPMTVIAIADFQSSTSKFCFKTGDELKVSFKSDDNFYAELENDYDWFPCNMVVPKKSEGDLKAGFKKLYTVTGFRIGTYPNLAEDEDEISFEINDLITVEEDVYDGWLFGYTNGQKGIYPINHTDEKVLFYYHIEFAKVVKEYSAKCTFELSVSPDDQIGVLHKNSNGWIIGVKEDFFQQIVYKSTSTILACICLDKKGTSPKLHLWRELSDLAYRKP